VVRSDFPLPVDPVGPVDPELPVPEPVELPLPVDEPLELVSLGPVFAELPPFMLSDEPEPVPCAPVSPFRLSQAIRPNESRIAAKKIFPMASLPCGPKGPVVR
jgi:hypothetical protein